MPVACEHVCAVGQKSVGPSRGVRRRGERQWRRRVEFERRGEVAELLVPDAGWLGQHVGSDGEPGAGLLVAVTGSDADDQVASRLGVVSEKLQLGVGGDVDGRRTSTGKECASSAPPNCTACPTCSTRAWAPASRMPR